MKETFKIELHVGQVAEINPDATINIFDYKIGSILYKNVKIDHTAADIQQPVIGHYVLYFTVNIGARETQVKVIRFYGNEITDDNKVLPGGVTDIQPGEHKMLSNTGASIYLANGSAFLGSIGQSIVFDDDTMYCNIKCKNLKVITLNGFVIEQKGDTLTIQKGIFDPTTGTVPHATTTITVSDLAVLIDSPTVNIGNNASKGVTRLGDEVKSTIAEDSAFWTWWSGLMSVLGAGGTGDALAAALSAYLGSNPAPSSLTGKVTSSSLTVKAAD